MNKLFVCSVLAVTLASCGGGDDKSAQSGATTTKTTTAPTTTKEETSQPKPAALVDCLEEAGMKNVKKADADLIRFFDPDGGSVNIHSFPSTSEARRYQKDASQVRTVRRGRLVAVYYTRSVEAETAVLTCLRSKAQF